MDLMPTGQPSRFKTLHPFYYLDHFKDVVSLYRKMYGIGFCSSIDQFLADLRNLNRDQICILIRAMNWKKNYFKPSEFAKFKEISDVARNLDQLVVHGFFKKTSIADLDKVLNSLTKEDLEQIFTSSNIAYKKSSSKSMLQQRLFDIEYSALTYDLELMFVDCKESFEKLLYACFGTLSVDLGTYALKDLGIRQSGKFNVSTSNRFESSDELESELYYSKLLKDFDPTALIYVQEIITILSPENRRPILTEKAERKFNQFVLEFFKTPGLSETDKIKILSLGTGSPVRMKLVREIYKSGDKLQAQVLAENICSHPTDDEELLEADNFLELKFGNKKLTSMTMLLRSAEVFEVDESFRGSVEFGVKEKLEKLGLKVDRAENELWRSLFGLLFWDILYGVKSLGIHSEFDRVPSGLLNGDFYQNHEETIVSRVEKLFTSEINLLLLKNYTANYGHRNAVFRWKRNSLEKIKRLLETQSSSLKLTLLRLAKDYKNNRSGFPDLVCYDAQGCFFVEVKGEGDSIRKNQMVQLQKMTAEGHATKIYAVNYFVDPNQTYVVVDVETTGGNPQNHRVTEIGAVKVKNGQIIDEFQTLLNPLRSIPANITKLTGITNQMVSTAPLFRDVADEFLKFCEGTIFAAHHVRFDYGFIKAEFERIGYRFRLPTFCTCASARKFLKGPKRFGLAPLCEYYGIELKTHHRALCDAKAAAELLMIINSRRN